MPLATRSEGHDCPLSHTRLRAILDTMVAHNIYPIARIVVAKDPLLARAKLEWAIKRKGTLEPWLDKNGNPWLDPHNTEVWQYAADLAKEAWDLGFSEVQFDYVRFPDEKRLVRETVYPLANGRLRAQVIRDQLGYVYSKLHPHLHSGASRVLTPGTELRTVYVEGEHFLIARRRLPRSIRSLRACTYTRNPTANPYSTIDHASSRSGAVRHPQPASFPCA